MRANFEDYDGAAYEQLLPGLQELASALRRGDRSTRLQLQRWRQRLEERLADDAHRLLPALAAKGADTAPLRRDHAQLGTLVGQAEADLERGTIEDFCDRAQQLMMALFVCRSHIDKLLGAYLRAGDS